MKIKKLILIYLGSFLMLIIVSLFLSSGNFTKNGSFDPYLNSVLNIANANTEGPNYSSGYTNNPQSCTITTPHTCSITVCYGGWCCTVGFDYTLDTQGTKNYCTYTGNPDMGCTYHECQANG